MRAIAKAFEGQDLTDIVNRCITLGTRRFPKEFPHIHDAADQLSDFLYGVQLGMRKFKKGKGDMVEYLTRQGVFYLRTKRYKALRKSLVVFCECGKRLNNMESKPCHGTKETRVIDTKEMCVDYSEWIIEDNSGEGFDGSPKKVVHVNENEED